MIPLLLFPIKIPLTVDRIEAHYAVVEWKDGTFSNIETHILPQSLHEGQALILYLRPKKEGNSVAISSHPALLHQAATLVELPYDNHVRIGHRYDLIIQPLRSTHVEKVRQFEFQRRVPSNLQRESSELLSSKP